MQKARTTSRIVTALLAGTVIGLPGAAAGVALAHPAYAPKQASCAILGTYHLGARVLPLATSARGHAGVPTPAPGHARVAAAIAQPAWLLGGSLVISAYTGCGGATMGSFTVHRTAVGPGIYGPRRGARAIPCAVSCWLPPTGVISATGRFVQDSM